MTEYKTRIFICNGRIHVRRGARLLPPKQARGYVMGLTYGSDGQNRRFYGAEYCPKCWRSSYRFLRL